MQMQYLQNVKTINRYDNLLKKQMVFTTKVVNRIFDKMNDGILLKDMKTLSTEVKLELDELVYLFILVQ
jgi:hypothetical protein